MRGDLRVGPEDGKILLGAPAFGSGLLRVGYGAVGDHRGDNGLDEDHLRLLDHLHSWAEPPWLLRGRVVPRLERERTQTQNRKISS